MTEPTWRCSECDTYNGAKVPLCEICGTSRSEASADKPASRGSARGTSAPKRKPDGAARSKAARSPAGASARRPGPWRCARCDTRNTAAEDSCLICGTPRKTAARATPAKSKASGTTAAKGGRKPAGAGKARETPGGAAPFGTGPLSEILADDMSGFVASPELARLLPEYFNPDGTLRHPVPTGGTPRKTTPARRPAPARTPPRPSPSESGPAGGGDKSTPPAPTPADTALACGCLVFIAAAIVLVIMWIINWPNLLPSSGHSGSPKSSAKPSVSATPSPTVSAGGPCPKDMAAMLPEATGAKLVAVYGRDNPDEEYTFCETKSHKLFYFAKTKGKAYSSPTAAEREKNGYLVRFSPYSYRFDSGKITGYKDGKEVWKDDLTPKSSPS